MPLIVQDRVVGVLDVESERVGFFTEDHQRTLSLLAPQIASSVENARLMRKSPQREQRMDQDLKAARKLQHVLQPRAGAGNPRAGDRDPLASGARNFRRRLRFLRARRRIRGDRVRRCQRQRRGGGALRRAGERPAAHSRAAPAQSRDADAVAERNSAGTQSGRAVCHAAVALWEPRTRQFKICATPARSRR